MIRHALALAAALAVVLCSATSAIAQSPATAPSTTRAVPGGRVLVFTLATGFRHATIPLSRVTIAKLGAESGAFTAVASDDVANFDRDALFAFDAVVFSQNTGELPLSDARKQNLLDFVSAGHGFVGVHSATDTFYKWPAYGDLIGAYFVSHPWTSKDTVTIKVEHPEDPIAAPFGDKPFALTEETYQFGPPYDRDKLRILLSLDTTATDMTKTNIVRTDHDFALAWTKPYGRGRVFYTALGHNPAVWNDARFQKHLLAGIEWAMAAGLRRPLAPAP